MEVNTEVTIQLCKSLEKAVAMYDLLHAHARGETDLTEDQLANVVTEVSREARETLREALGRPPAIPHWSSYVGRQVS